MSALLTRRQTLGALPAGLLPAKKSETHHVDLFRWKYPLAVTNSPGPPNEPPVTSPIELVPPPVVLAPSLRDQLQLDAIVIELLMLVTQPANPNPALLDVDAVFPLIAGYTVAEIQPVATSRFQGDPGWSFWRGVVNLPQSLPVWPADQLELHIVSTIRDTTPGDIWQAGLSQNPTPLAPGNPGSSVTLWGHYASEDQ